MEYFSFTVPFRRSRSAYAWQQTSYRMNAFCTVLLILWVVIELGVRTFFPMETWILLNRILNIVVVLIGSTIAAYIFHLIVNHWPSMRKQAGRQAGVEEHITSILLYYNELFMGLLKHHPRTDTGVLGYYGAWNVLDAPSIYKLMVGTRASTGTNPDNDPFRWCFYTAKSSMAQAANHLAEFDDVLSEWQLSFVRASSGIFQDEDSTWQESHDDEFHRLMMLHALSLTVTPYFKYMQDLVLKGRNMTVDAECVIGQNTYQDVWDQIEVLRKRPGFALDTI